MGKLKGDKQSRKRAFSENWKSLEKEIANDKKGKHERTTKKSLNEIQRDRKRKLLSLNNEANSKKVKKDYDDLNNKSSKESKIKKKLPAHTTKTVKEFGPNVQAQTITQKTVDRKTDKKQKWSKEGAMDVWFDDIPIEDIIEAEEDSANSLNIVSKKASRLETSHTAKKLVKTNAFGGLTKVVAMDCEMVGVGEGGRESVLARVSLVNQFGKCIYDKFVKAREEVTDYRTFVSGVRPVDLENAEDFEVVQKEVSDILQGRILVGHALWNDMKVLFLDHPKKCIRDTARYKPFKTMVGGRSPALRVLCSKILGIQVQKGEHSSVQDAQAAMRLYTMFKKQWEAEAPKTVLSKNQKKKHKADELIKAMKERT